MKKIVVLTSLLTAMQLNAFWGAAYFAMQGPSIPSVMCENQIFNKSGKVADGTSIKSDDPAIISVEIHDKHFTLTAHRPGKATITITNKKGKVKETHEVIVAYNSLIEIPLQAYVGDKIYVKSLKTKSVDNVTSNDTTLVPVLRKQFTYEYYYVIKCKKPGTVTLQQSGKTVSLKILEKNDTDAKSKNKKSKNKKSKNKKSKNKKSKNKKSKNKKSN